MNKKVTKKGTSSGLPDCKKCKKANGGKCPDEIKKVSMDVADVHALLDFAFVTRFLLITTSHDFKKGSRGDKMLKNVDKCGAFLQHIAKIVGYEPPKVSKEDVEKVVNPTKKGGKTAKKSVKAK